jgi:hypothetical protein
MMTVRFLMTVALAAGLAACSGGTTATTDKDGGTTDGATDTNTNTNTNTDGGGGGDSGGGGTGGGAFDPSFMTIAGDMPWDGTANQLVDVNIQGYAIPASITIEFGDSVWNAQGFDASLTDHYCFLVMPLTSSAFAAWAQGNPDVYYGVDFTGTIDDVVTNCGDATHPMAALFGTNDIRDAIVTYYGTWGLGVSKPGPLFDQFTSTTFLANNCVGAYVQNADFVVPSDGVSSGQDHYYSFPVAMDPTTFEAQIDSNYYFISVPPNQVFDGVSLATAWYRIFDFYSWQFS